MLHMISIHQNFLSVPPRFSGKLRGLVVSKITSGRLLLSRTSVASTSVSHPKPWDETLSFQSLHNISACTVKKEKDKDDLEEFG